MNFNEALNKIENVQDCYTTRDIDDIKSVLNTKKLFHVDGNDQEAAKKIWCYETILKIQEDYLIAYDFLKRREFYQAWCKFERAELSAGFLYPHFDLETDKYSLSFICKHIEKYQSLYPYKVFFSTEFLEKEKVCTICDNTISLRNHCGHKVGEIYDGKMASRKVTDFEMLGVSLVKNPTHKYSVPFRSDKNDKRIDHYNYSIISYLIERLNNPFHGWDFEWQEELIPHSKFPNFGRNDKCPCESGKKYKQCCLNKKGVKSPHCKFSFEVNPPVSLQTHEYTF